MEDFDEKTIQILNEIFVKATKDPEFRKALLAGPSSVLDKYELSSEAKQNILSAIKEMDT